MSKGRVRKRPRFIQKAIKSPGSFTRQAAKADMSPAMFQQHVLAHPGEYSATTRKRAQLRKTLVRMGTKKRRK